MANLFRSGIPTGADVKRLLDTYSELKVGDEIAHEDVEGVLQITRTASRYRTVTGAWRRFLQRQENKQVEAVPGIGFRVLNPKERVEVGLQKFGSGTKKQARAIRAVQATPDEGLDAVSLKKKEHMVRLGVVILNHATDLVRAIQPPAPAEQAAQLRKIVHRPETTLVQEPA